MSYSPGSIHVTEEAVYILLPDLDAKIVKHVTAWASSVDVGATVTIAEMMNFKGSDHGLPLEVVMKHLFPADGSPCLIEGVVCVGEVMPYTITKTD
jgi:hypothetical protein